MNYRAIYTSLVFSARAKHRIKSSEEYFEEHHIFPRSLFPEYKKNKHNLVLLTAREHYIAHKLLCKIWPSRAMYAAIWQMSIKSKKSDSPYKYIVSSREYEWAKKLFVSELKANHWEWTSLSSISVQSEERNLKNLAKRTGITKHSETICRRW